MALPRWLAKVNKRIFNPREVRRGRYPVLIHVGRRSGRTFHTPMDAFPTDTGYICVVRYGAESDWVRNTLAAGRVRLRVGDDELELTSPRVVSHEEAVTRFDPPDNFTRADDYLLLENIVDSAGEP